MMDMLGIKCINYKINNDFMAFYCDEEIKFVYNDISVIIDNKVMRRYLESLFYIIHSWKNEYININMVDGNDWQLDIIFLDNNVTTFRGHSMFPYNFESFENLNQTIINEVMK